MTAENFFTGSCSLFIEFMNILQPKTRNLRLLVFDDVLKVIRSRAI